jgi:pyridoxine 5-phosphate synthase
MVHLGVNIDHVATVRQARRTYEPDPVWAAALAELGGADSITIHLREDRRHIQDRDLEILRQTVSVPLNLELSVNKAIVDIACRTKPDQATLVPESREEITTEGGLDVLKHHRVVADAIRALQDAGIVVSLFLDADTQQLETAKELGATAVELHTGGYANAKAGKEQEAELEKLRAGGTLIRRLGLKLHAGHGLNYHNVQPVAQIEGMAELNIGHSIVARAVMVGFERAVREMKQLLS